jgi:hypothetical protein
MSDIIVRCGRSSTCLTPRQSVRNSLRPLRGRSPYRAIYRRVKDVFVIAAICPEAIKDPKGFRRGCAIALERLAELDETAEEE